MCTKMYIHVICGRVLEHEQTPLLVLKARHLDGSAFSTGMYMYTGMADWALGWVLRGLGVVAENEPSKL